VRTGARPALALIALALAGCSGPGDECVSGESACDGGVQLTCIAFSTGRRSSRLAWSPQACTGACVTNNSGVATCQLSSAPVPECAGHVVNACLRNQIVQCSPDGYATAVVTDCGSRLCVDSPGCGPICVASLTPEPQCTPTTASVCNGAVPTDCLCGYPTGVHPACASADLCKTSLPSTGADGGVPAASDAGGAATMSVAFCAVRPDRNPNCRLGMDDMVCDGNVLVRCHDGWEIDRSTCQGECHAYGGVGFCG
jgi:hypothetical protein